MIYRIFADVLVGLHLAFVLFVVLGGGVVLWRRRMALLHIPAVAWGVFIELSGGVCPLTPLEIRFRLLGGEAGYSGGFVEHYLIPLLYPSVLTRAQQVGLGVFVAILNLGLYSWILRVALRARKPRPQADS